MNIFKFYENADIADKCFEEVYCIVGRFINTNVYPLFYNFAPNRDNDGLLSYFGFELRNAYIMNNTVLAQKYKDDIDALLSRMFGADSIIEGTSQMIRLATKYKNGIGVRMDTATKLKDLLYSQLRTIDTCHEVSIPYKMNFSEIPKCLYLYKQVLANSIYISYLFSDYLVHNITVRQVTVSTVNVLDSLNIKQLTLLLNILSDSDLNISLLESKYAQYDLDIKLMEQEIATKLSQAESAESGNTLLAQRSDSILLRDGLLKCVNNFGKTLSSPFQSEIASSDLTVCTTQLINMFSRITMDVVVNYIRLNPERAEKDVKYYIYKLAGERESLTAFTSSVVTFLECGLGFITDISDIKDAGSHVETGNLNDTSEIINFVNGSGNITSVESQLLLKETMSYIRSTELIKVFDCIPFSKMTEIFKEVLTDVSPNAVPIVSTFSQILINDCVSYLINEVKIDTLETYTTDIVAICTDATLDYFNDEKIYNIEEIEVLSCVPAFLIYYESLVALLIELDSIIESTTNIAEYNEDTVYDPSSLSAIVRQQLQAVITRRLNYTSNEIQVDSVITRVARDSDKCAIDSEISTHLNNLDFKEIGAVISQHLADMLAVGFDSISHGYLSSGDVQKAFGDSFFAMSLLDMHKYSAHVLDDNMIILSKPQKFANCMIAVTTENVNLIQILDKWDYLSKHEKYIHIEVGVEELTKSTERNVSNMNLVYTVNIDGKPVYKDSRVFNYDKDIDVDNYPKKVVGHKVEVETKLNYYANQRGVKGNKDAMFVDPKIVEKESKDILAQLLNIFMQKDNKEVSKTEDVHADKNERVTTTASSDNIGVYKVEKDVPNVVPLIGSLKEKYVHIIGNLSSSATDRLFKQVFDDVFHILIDLYHRWYFIPDRGPYDEMILPSEDYDYTNHPVNGFTEHPFPNGSDLATTEIAVPIEIISNVLDFLHEVFNSYFNFYRNVVPQQALTHFVATYYDWITIYLPENIDKIPQYYPNDYEIIENDMSPLENYERLYRWIRWYAEALVNNISEEDKTLLVGDKYVTMLITELENYYNMHHGEFYRFASVNDKEKGVRHKILKTLQSFVTKTGTGFTHKYLPKNDEYVRNRWKEGGRK